MCSKISEPFNFCWFVFTLPLMIDIAQCYLYKGIFISMETWSLGLSSEVIYGDGFNNIVLGFGNPCLSFVGLVPTFLHMHMWEIS